ncbi:sex-determining region Y protein [Elysia marginata]|uniref:Sex-determining region Y protein n=1 Tax=Elysia marginata TaxID=1093978 RepID=A0AAV4K0L8_9GAST|nr:sex-determining region Y protein [Elysia marginata]
MMNPITGLDPMLSGLSCEDWSSLSMAAAYPSPLPLPSLSRTSGAFTIPVEGLISPEPSSAFTDLSYLFSSGERKKVGSIEMEEDEDVKNVLSSTSCPSPDEMSLDDIDMGSHTAVDIKSELEDSEYNDDNLSTTNSEESFEAVSPVGSVNTLQLTEQEARKYVEEQFERIAFLPSSSMTQREKISFILSQSDCKEFTVEDIVNFDKRKNESARACAKIVQNIPQRYRWECVQPEEIPCCYTIVADCKKVSSRDKPPRPMNAFMIWAQGARRLINELCPKMQNALISEALGYFWRLKSDSFKHFFEDEKVKLRRFHNVEFPGYKYKPKTKVQKAKEKQELSLSKAKLRASQKREKAQKLKAAPSNEASSLFKRRTGAKCGRPRKQKPGSDTDTKSKPPAALSIPVLPTKDCKASRASNSNGYTQMSPTKPAIKDMLTLKILNDRRSKKSVVVTPVGQVSSACDTTSAKDSVHTMFGQLSPLEMNQSSVGDILDELSGFENQLDVGGSYTAQTVPDNFLTSSVYDTPANTPPAEEDEQQQQHPPHNFLSAAQYVKPEPPSSSPSLPLPSTSAISFLRTPSSYTPLKVSTTHDAMFSPISTAASTSSCSSRTQILMPSLSAMLSSPAKNSPFSATTQNAPSNRAPAGAYITLTPTKNVGVAKGRGRFSNIVNLQWAGKNTKTVNAPCPTTCKANTLQTAPLLKAIGNNKNSANTSFPVVNKIIRAKTLDPKNIGLSANIDTNNNSSSSSSNNTTGCVSMGGPPSYAMSIMNLKVVSAVTDSYDLDSLFLDPNVPLLSEDVMRSYIDSL